MKTFHCHQKISSLRKTDLAGPLFCQLMVNKYIKRQKYLSSDKISVTLVYFVSQKTEVNIS